MGPREEDNDVLLLGVVTVICVCLAGLLNLSQPVVAAAKAMTVIASDEPIRIVGAPFVPNTNPRER
jgi:hypothetical protein